MGDAATVAAASTSMPPRLFMDARQMPYIPLPEELNFVKYFDEQALQKHKAQGDVAVKRAVTHLRSRIKPGSCVRRTREKTGSHLRVPFAKLGIDLLRFQHSDDA